MNRGLSAWESADILPFGAFVERLYTDALYSDIGSRLPLLSTAPQEQELWEAVIRASAWGEALLTVSRAAADARKAWKLAHEWRLAVALESASVGEDARAFAEWTRDYARWCHRKGITDNARLADVVAPLLQEAALDKPKLLVPYSFDVMPPQVREFLQACLAQGAEVLDCAPEAQASQVSRMTFPSARQELEAAANWAREKLEQGARHIGVVVPELAQRRKAVARVFARVIHPAHNLPGARQKTLPFNISLGVPLTDYPLVRAALSILELALGEIPFEQASKLIRSPFLGGAEAELSARAQFDARLRKQAPARVTLGKWVSLTEGASAVVPILQGRLSTLLTLALEFSTRGAADDERSPHDWGRRFSALLAAVGFPGERGLDSDEFQTQAKFNELLAEFAKLELVTPKMGYSRALSRLRRLCADTLFQPQTPAAPIQVLGVLESAGLRFDALWVSGLTDEVWPLAAAPNPFLPPALQREAGIPEASAEASLARGKRITQGWMAAAGEVVVTHPATEEDRMLLASPLISGIPLAEEAIGIRERYRDRIFAAREIETVQDGRAPALATPTPKGGTRILSDQAACPFRAFARYRLAAESLEEPVPGPDARTRGVLLHTLMMELWSELRDSSRLQEDCGPAIERAAAAAVRAAALEEPFAGLERRRLAKLAREWLEVERRRPPFEVVALEEKRKLAIAGLELNGRIDRMDRLATSGPVSGSPVSDNSLSGRQSGEYLLIDYKTGRPTPKDWLGERPDDPQLPLYALNMEENVVAVAFGKLKTGDMKYMGFSDRKDLLPGVKPALDWDALVEGWHRELHTLGSGFAAGDARVDPKKGLNTCRYCDLQPLCRVYERINALTEDDQKEEEGADD